MSEKDLHNAILCALSKLPIGDCWAWDNRGVGLFYTQRGNFIRLGIDGQADIICIVRGFVLGVEVKTKTGVLAEHQIGWGAMLDDAGGLYICVRSVSDAISAIEEAKKTKDISELKSALSALGLRNFTKKGKSENK